MRKLQETATINIQIPLMNADGTPAIGETTGLSTKIIKPDGTVLSGYTEATFTEPNSDGTYNVSFPSNAPAKAFTLEDQANPYSLTLDSSTADVEPTTIPIWITSQYPWETSLESTTQAISGDMALDDTVAKEDTLDATTLALSGDIQSINDEITDGTYGLSALKTLIDGLDTQLDSLALEATSLSISGDIQTLQDIVEAIDIELDGLATEATLTAIKGAGFDTGTHSLKQIKDRIG